MVVTTAVATPDGEPFRRLTVEEYERIPDEVFDGERIELIEGLLYCVGDQTEANSFSRHYAWHALERIFEPEHFVVMRMPIRFGGFSKVEPKLAVLRGDFEDYLHHRVEPHNDIIVLVEISDTSLRYDRVNKARLYAQHGVPEYWIVDVQARTLEVRRRPKPERGIYAETVVLSESESIEAGERTIAVSDLLPKRA